MSLADISVKRPVFAWMMMLAILIFGGIAFSRLGVSQLPDIDYPVININVTFTGASPEVMAADIIDVIEDAVMTVQGVKRVSSIAKAEQASITVEFDIERNIDLALQDIQSKVSQAQRWLPADMDPPTIVKNNPDDQPILWVSLSGDMEPRRIMEYARDKLKDRLQTVTGVSEIWLSGYLAPNLRVWADNEKLTQYDLSINDVIDAITREHAEVPAGRLETSSRETNLRFMGEAFTPAEFGEIVISKRGGAPNFADIRLKDVARVEYGMEDVRRISRVNGKAAIGLGIKKQRGSNAVAVAKAVRERIAELNDQLPPGLRLQISFDSTRFIEESIAELVFNLILSALLTAFVCLVFIGSISSTINILMAIPVSLIGTFLCLYFLGYTLNTFTLLGLILSIGIVVDDAIMVLENIMRHRSEGKSAREAALVGTHEIQLAALATTLALIAIFIPVIFMQGFIGKLFLQFGVTLSIAVLISLFEALTFMPMRASQIAGRAVGQSAFVRTIDGIMLRLMTGYQNLLIMCLSHRWKIVLISTAVFIASLGIVKMLPSEFVPAQDQSMFLLRIKTPVGSSIDFTNRQVKPVEEFLMQDPSVQRYFLAVGGFSGGDVDSAVIFVTLKPRDQRPINPVTGKHFTQFETADAAARIARIFGMVTLEKMTEQVRDSVPGDKILFKPDVTAFVMDLSMRGYTAQRGFPVEFSIRGADWETLAQASQKIVEAMKTDSHFKDVDSDYLIGMPEIRILPNRDRARERGVGMKDIGDAVGSLFGGVRAGKYTENGRRADVRVRLEADHRISEEDIRQVFVRNYKGELVPLRELVTLVPRDALQSITREDREGSIRIMANVGDGVSQQKALARAEELARKHLPENYRFLWSGSSQAMQESNQSLMWAFVLGIMIAYMILASQYNSLLDPIAIFMAMPFSLTGAFLALYATGLALNIYSFIGIILLMGIVKKNSILLVDFSRQRRLAGDSVREAILHACPQRLRPILMTSVTTLAGAVPPALALGPGAETRIPMAVVILGGVTLSTALTLFVVPCVYSLLSSLQRRNPA